MIYAVLVALCVIIASIAVVAVDRDKVVVFYACIMGVAAAMFLATVVVVANLPPCPPAPEIYGPPAPEVSK